MNVFNARRRTVRFLSFLALVLGLTQAVTMAAQIHNGTRSGGQELHVVVKLHGSLFKSATVKVTSVGGTDTMKATGNGSGTYSIALGPGDYTVTATTPHTSATGTVTIVPSTQTKILVLNLVATAPTKP